MITTVSTEGIIEISWTISSHRWENQDTNGKGTNWKLSTCTIHIRAGTACPSAQLPVRWHFCLHFLLWGEGGPPPPSGEASIVYIFESDHAESESGSVMSNSLWPHGLYSPWNSPGQNTGVGSPSLLQRIFPTQGSNPGLPHCRWILCQLSHSPGKPRLDHARYPQIN